MEKKNLFSSVMKTANQLKYGFGLPMNIALRTAWTLFRSCKVVFIKDNGKIREASILSARKLVQLSDLQKIQDGRFSTEVLYQKGWCQVKVYKIKMMVGKGLLPKKNSPFLFQNFKFNFYVSQCIVNIWRLRANRKQS